MNYKTMTKEQLIELLEQKDSDLKNYERVKKERDLFLKGSKEKDQQLATYKELVNDKQDKTEHLVKQVVNESNAKIAQLSQQQVAIAQEYEFSAKGNKDFVETINDLMTLHDAAHSTIKGLVSRIKAVYVEEE